MKSAQSDALDETSETLRPENSSVYLLWMIWVAWIPFFIPVLVDLFRSNPPLPRLVISLLGVLLFFTIYLWASWLDSRYLSSARSLSAQVPERVWVVLVILIALAVALSLLNGGNGWLGLFYYISGYAGGRLSTVRTILVVLGLLILATVTALLANNDLSVTGQTLLYIAVIGVIITSVGQVFVINRKLRLAREEIARLAITAERLRIARDLHDLLGHNLSLITLKSELAGRLVAGQPDRAALEIKDIEQVARITLQEVREAVSSYRQPTLDSEIQAAQEILTAAGIAFRFEGEAEKPAGLPSPVETALSRTVREGVTNVIKHSRAGQCIIRIGRDQQTIQVEIIDDGKNSAGPNGQAGNGLRGLGERVAALEGELEAAPKSGGGFRLAVILPLNPRKNTSSQKLPASTVLQTTHRPPATAINNSSLNDEKGDH